MPIGVLDVGSNTIRLLVAHVEGGTVVPLGSAKVRLALGEEIERYGGVSEVHVATAAKAVRKLAGSARRLGVESLDVFLTAPGRQAENSAELVAAISRAASVPVRVLSAEEEGRLAYAGAVANSPLPLPERVAVCDVGGASTEIAVGSSHGDPEWVRSIALGSVRLTTRIVQGERITRGELADARGEAADAFESVQPPPAGAALAVGGSARAARRLVGPELGHDELAEALRLVVSRDPRAIARKYGVDRDRARILPGGLVLLAEVQRRLGVPLHVCDGGIREGAVIASLERLAA